MKSVRLKPQTLIQTALADAAKVLQSDRELTDAQVAKLPEALRGVVDDFKAAGNERVQGADVLAALKRSLEEGLKQSLAQGELVAGELDPDLGALLSFSSVGVQVQKALSERAAPADFSSAAQDAQVALDQASLSVVSQVRVLKELSRAAQLAKTDAPDQAILLDGIAKDRATITRRVVDETVRSAEAALKQAPGDVARKQQLAAALDAAIAVHAAINPKSSRVKTLQKQLAQVGVAPPRSKASQPFFARFLENQNRGQAAQVEEPRMMVTMKYPSDNEDGGADTTQAVTKKFPSDAEDSGADDGGAIVTTMKAPSDHEDGGVDEPGDGGSFVTEKYPSDAEDGGVDGPGDGVFTTLKYPSDNEDGGEGSVDDGGGMMVTMKFPSDNEDGGDGGVDDGGGMMVTMKYPSDNEDGGVVDGPGGVGEIPAVDGDVAKGLAVGIAEVAYQGPEAVEQKIAEIKDLMTRARFTAEGLREKEAELAGLDATLRGGAWIGVRLGEINDVMTAGLLAPDALASLTLEKDVLKRLHAALSVGFADRAADLSARPSRSEGEDVAVKVLLAGFEGRAALASRLEDIDRLLTTALFDEGGLRRIQAERAVVKALLHGGPQLAAELQATEEALQSFGGTPQEGAKLETRAAALRVVLEAARVARDHPSL